MNKKQRKLSLQKIEQQLLPRLGFLGGILLTFSICSLVYGFFVHPLSAPNELVLQAELQSQGMDLSLIEVGEDDPNTLLPEDILNFYFVSLIFGAVGFFCIFTSWKKKHLMQKPR
jgi:hypothetical protein